MLSAAAVSPKFPHALCSPVTLTPMPSSRSVSLSSRLPHRDRTGQKVLVTGAASGLGLELTTLFLARGATVTATDLHSEEPESIAGLAGRFPGQVTYRTLDVTSLADWEDAASEFSVDNPLDVLVSNAGIAVGGRIDHTPVSTWEKALDINLLGSVRGCHTFVPLIRDGGQIVLTASAAGLVSAPAMSTYNATKAATVSLAETLSAELRHRRIAVSALCPQFFRSGLASSLISDDDTATSLANALLTRTWLTAEIVARRAMTGIDARRLVVTPDGFATFSWYSKRFTRPGYLFVTRTIGRVLARRGE